MIWIALLLIVLAGIAEHYKDLSEEGKLGGYWDKNHLPYGEWFRAKGLAPTDEGDIKTWRDARALWWKVHWLQGGVWDYIPVWIRQYLSFRDGWHLLKFVSLNSFAVAVVMLSGLPWWWFLIIRSCFSLPETILRRYKIQSFKWKE
jgi:hypothetical protein